MATRSRSIASKSPAALAFALVCNAAVAFIDGDLIEGRAGARRERP